MVISLELPVWRSGVAQVQGLEGTHKLFTWTRKPRQTKPRSRQTHIKPRGRPCHKPPPTSNVIVRSNWKTSYQMCPLTMHIILKPGLSRDQFKALLLRLILRGKKIYFLLEKKIMCCVEGFHQNVYEFLHSSPWRPLGWRLDVWVELYVSWFSLLSGVY